MLQQPQFEPTSPGFARHRVRPEIRRRVFELTERDFEVIGIVRTEFERRVKPKVLELYPDEQYQNIFVGDLVADERIDIELLMNPKQDQPSDQAPDERIEDFREFVALLGKAQKWGLDNLFRILGGIREPLLAQWSLGLVWDQFVSSMAVNHSETVAVTLCRQKLDTIADFTEDVKQKLIERLRLDYADQTQKNDLVKWKNDFHQTTSDVNFADGLRLIERLNSDDNAELKKTSFDNLSVLAMNMIEHEAKKSAGAAISFYLSLPSRLVLERRVIGAALKEEITNWLSRNHYSGDKFNHFVRDNLLPACPEVYALFATDYNTREHFSSEDRFSTFKLIKDRPDLRVAAAALFSLDDFHPERQAELKPILLDLYLRHQPEKILMSIELYRSEVEQLDFDQQKILADKSIERGTLAEQLASVPFRPETLEYIYFKMLETGKFVFLTEPKNLKRLGKNRSELMNDLAVTANSEIYADPHFWWMWFQFYRDKPNISIVGYMQRFAAGNIIQFNQALLDQLLQLDDFEVIFTPRQHATYQELKAAFPDSPAGVKPEPAAAYLHAMRAQVGDSLDQTLITMRNCVREVGPYVMPHILALYRHLKDGAPLTADQERLGIKTMADLKNYVDPVYDIDNKSEKALETSGQPRLVTRLKLSPSQSETDLVVKTGDKMLVKSFDTFSQAKHVRYGDIDAIEKASQAKRADMINVRLAPNIEGQMPLRERAVDIVAQYFGRRFYAPPTNIKMLGTDDYGSSQLFIANTRGFNDYRHETHGAQADSDEFLKLLLIDLMLWNADRNNDNVLINNQHHVVMIDNGFTFFHYHLRLLHHPQIFYGRVIPAGFVESLMSLSSDLDLKSDLRERLLGYLTAEDVDAFLARVDYLADNIKRNNNIMNPNLFADLRYDPRDRTTPNLESADADEGLEHVLITGGSRYEFIMGVLPGSDEEIIRKFKQDLPEYQLPGPINADKLEVHRLNQPTIFEYNSI